jgi:hypothetical protein
MSAPVPLGVPNGAVSNEIGYVDSPAARTARGRSRRLRLASWGRIAAVVAALLLYVRFFDYSKPQLVDGLWLVAIVLWVFEIRSCDPAGLLGLHVRRADLLPIALILPLFAAAWLPFYNNWRWAYTGDSFGVFAQGYWFGRNGLRQSLLSVHGIDNSFTYLWEVSYNFPMRLFAPTLWWHRIGQLLWACLALSAIYAFFTVTLKRYWATAIVAATAINYVWLWFSYVSYLKIDSFVFYFLTLTFATLIWEQPDRLGPWMLCGLTGGLSLFYTPTAWSAVILVGLALGIGAAVTRRFLQAAVYGVSVLIVATPLLLEIRWFLSMMASQTAPVLQWDYLQRIFVQVFLMPYDFPYYKLGVQGAFLRWPLGWLYLVGVGIAAIALLPPVRRALRIPGIAAPLLILLLWDAVLLTLTNKGYGQPSTKRAYNLIPLQIFFALLPLMLVSAWAARWRWLQRAAAALVVAALATYAWHNLHLMVFPQPLVYGANLFDGMIELRQLHPERKVVLITRREGMAATFAANELLNVAYKLADTVQPTAEISPATVERVCQQGALLCYEPNYDAQQMAPLLARYEQRLRRFPLQNSFEVVCFECLPAPGAAPHGS